jgi:ABC-2 type transport system permease protein
MSELALPGQLTLRRRRPATTSVLIGRAIRLNLRNVDAMITALVLPVMMMLLFVYLFGGALHVGTAYVDYVVPGVLVLCAGYGASLTAVRVCVDVTGGIIDRFRSLDVGGVAFLTGHVVASVVRNAISMVLVVSVALAIGFRPHADLAGWLVAAGVLLAFIVAISWLSAVLGLLVSSPDAVSGATFILLFLPYASSGFVPVDTMPTWLRGFARNQPSTPVIESVRQHLMALPGNSLGLALAWCGGILAVAVVASAWAFRRRTAA